MKKIRLHQVVSLKFGQQGFTLVEMMVAMLIGIFLSMALTGIYIALKRNFLGEDSIVNSQENQRLAFNILTNGFQSAGYFLDPINQNAESVFLVNTEAGFKAAGQVIYGTTDNNGRQAVSIRYQAAPSDGILNCAGSENLTGANAIFINTYSLSANNELMCATSVNGGALSSVVLSRNISNITFQYATDSDNNGVVDSYLTSTQVDAVGWSLVHGVRIDLTLMDTINSAESAKKAMPKSLTHFVNLMNTYEIP